MNNRKEMITVDIEALAVVLANDAFEQDTKGVPEEDIYINVLQEKILPWEDDTYVKEYRSRWVYLYDTLKNKYRDLIESCSVEVMS